MKSRIPLCVEAHFFIASNSACVSLPYVYYSLLKTTVPAFLKNHFFSNIVLVLKRTLCCLVKDTMDRHDFGGSIVFFKKI